MDNACRLPFRVRVDDVEYGFGAHALLTAPGCRGGLHLGDFTSGTTAAIVNARRTVGRLEVKRRIPAIWIALGAIAFSCASTEAQQRLTVATYGGNWGEAQKACILDPFAKASGVQVVQEMSVSTITYNKLKQQKGNPSIDIAWIDGGISELASADGVVAAIDPAKVANIAGLIDEAVYKTKDGRIYALSTGFYALGIAYNTKELKEAPQSWWDIWKPEYAGKVTLPSPVNAAGIPFFAHIITLTGGSLDNPTSGVEKLKTIKA